MAVVVAAGVVDVEADWVSKTLDKAIETRRLHAEVDCVECRIANNQC